jgi:hypothetical protein
MTDSSLSDTWLSELAVVTSRAVKHLFVPGVPLFATPFAKRIRIVLYIVQTHNDYDPRFGCCSSAANNFKRPFKFFPAKYRAPDYFNFDEFSAELQRLAAPNQKILISQRKLSVATERTVLLAFHQSIRVIVDSFFVFSFSFVFFLFVC